VLAAISQPARKVRVLARANHTAVNTDTTSTAAPTALASAAHSQRSLHTPPPVGMASAYRAAATPK